MGTLADILRIGTRNVARNLRRSAITGAMVALGVAASLFFRGYVVGLQDAMTAMLIEEASGAMQVERRGYAEAGELAPLDLDLPTGGELEALVRRTGGVREVAPRLRFNALLVSGEISSAVAALGVDPQRERRVCPFGPAGRARSPGHYGLEGPGLSGPGGEDGVVLGSTLAAGLRLRVGDPVTLLAQTQGGSTDAVDAVVRGTFRTSDAEVNKRLLALPIGLAQRLLHMPGRATSFALAVERPAIPGTAAALRGALAGLAPAAVRTWKELAPYYRDVIELQDDVMDIVAGLLFVLMVAGVANTMMMSVFEREREIGTLLALGYRRRAIRLLFVAEAGVLGVVSGAAGAGFGSAVVAACARVGLPFKVSGAGMILNRPRVEPAHVAAAVALALGAALLAGAYPAWRASKLQPADALRAT
jgi:putative ABC transport system permease protein